MRTAMLVFTMVLQSIFANATCGSAKKAVFFANGMFNDRAGASKSLIYLWSAYASKYPKSKVMLHELAFNTDEPMLQQLFQVYRQKVKDSNLSFWKSFAFIFSKMDNKEYKDLMGRLLSEERLKDHDLREQIRRYKTLLGDGFEIATIAHSQGNFYTLFSFENLGSDKTQMISVATPASAVYGGGPYFTFYSDGVIKYIPTALPPNTTRLEAGVFDHEFVKHYMQDPVTGDKILSAVNHSIMNYEKSDVRSLNPADAYFNSDMTPILEWFNKYLSSGRKLLAGECLAAEALFSVFALHGRSCEERNFSTFKESIQACGTDLDSNGRGETSCPFYSGMDFGNPYKGFYPSEYREHYQINPHCEITYEIFRRNYKSEVAASLKMLEVLGAGNGATK